MILMSRKLQELMNELKMNSSETYYHSVNVKNLTFKMIKLMNADHVTDYSQAQIDAVCKGALLHDIGKLHVKNVILTKESSLTDEEMRDIREHPDFSFAAVKNEPKPDEYEIVTNICLYHHERIDGNGYKHKKDIPLYVQIVSVCDVFSALCFDRVYRDALSYDEAIATIESGRSGYFDPMIIDYLKKAAKEFKE